MALTANQDWLYKQMSGMNVDLGSEEQFAHAMQDESNRQWVYEQAGKMGIDLGTPEQFSSAMLSGQSQPTNPSVKTNPAPTTEAQYQANLQQQDAAQGNAQAAPIVYNMNGGTGHGNLFTQQRAGTIFSPEMVTNDTASVFGTPKEGFERHERTKEFLNGRDIGAVSREEMEAIRSIVLTEEENARRAAQGQEPVASPYASILNGAEGQDLVYRMMAIQQSNKERPGLEGEDRGRDINRRYKALAHLPEHEAQWAEDEKIFNEVWDEAKRAGNAAANEVYKSMPSSVSSTPSAMGGGFGTIGYSLMASKESNKHTDPNKISEETIKEIISRYDTRIENETKQRLRESITEELGETSISDQELSSMVDEAYNTLKRQAEQQVKTQSKIDDSDIAVYLDYVQQQMQDRFIDASTPQSDVEYFVRKVVEGNIIGQLAQLYTSTPAQRAYDVQGLQKYESQLGGLKAFGLNTGASLTGIVLDPLMWVAPEVGGVAGRTAVRAIGGRVIGKMGYAGAEELAARAMVQKGLLNTAQRYASSAATFAMIDAGHDVFNQLYYPTFNPETGQYENASWNPLQTLGAMGKGAATGTLFAGAGILGDKAQVAVGKLWNESAGVVAGRATHFTLGTNAMVGTSVASQLLQGKSIDEINWGREYADAAAMQLFFDIKGGAEGLMRTYSEYAKAGQKLTIPETFRANWEQMKRGAYANTFTQEEIEQFNKAGFKGSNAYQLLLNLNGGKAFESLRDLYVALDKVANDPTIDTQAKYKLARLIYGKVDANLKPIQVDAYKDEQGRYVVRTYDNAGQNYETKYFTNEAKANEYRQQQYDVTRNNLREWQEDVVRNYQFAQDLQDVADKAIIEIQKQYPQYSKEQLYGIMRESLLNPHAGRGNAISQNAEADAIRGMFEEYLTNNTSSFFDALKAVREQAADDSGIKESELNNILSQDYKDLDFKKRSIYDNYLRRLAEAMPNPASESTRITGELEAGGPDDYFTNPQQPQAPVESIQPTREEVVRQEVVAEVTPNTHKNGYIYPVAMPGNAEKTGYIVGEVVPVIDESNPEQLKIENDDVVTVKWSDGTVTQERARDLDLTGAPMMAQQAIDIEVENQMYGYTQQRIQNGEQPVLMRNGEGILEGFFPTEGGLLEDQNGVQYTPEQLAEQGWQETNPVLFVNDTQQIAALDNGDGTYTQVDALGNPVSEPMSAEAFSEQGFAMVPLEEEQPKSQAPVEAPVVEQAPVETAPEVQQPEVQEPAAPVVPNIETMSAADYAGAAVEYMGSREYVDEYLDGEIKKVQQQLGVANRKKVGNVTDMADFKAKKDAIEAEKKALQTRLDKLTEAREKAKSYLTIAEREARAKAEAERRAAEEAMRIAREQAAAAEAARLEQERIDRELKKGVPDFSEDNDKDARARGFHVQNGVVIRRQEPLQPLATGKATTVQFAKGDNGAAEAHHVLIPFTMAQPSHINGQRNPAFFISEAQPKDRRDQVSKVTSDMMAQNIHPDEIVEGATAYVGAPVLNARGEAVQGNNRLDALIKMYQSHPESVAKYKQYLIDNAVALGYTEADIETIRNNDVIDVRMLDNVTDEQAILLGQKKATDLETGGVQLIDPQVTANQLNREEGRLQRFAEILLNTNDDEATLADLTLRNGKTALEYLQKLNIINDAQAQSAFDSRGNMTAEAKAALQGVLRQVVYTDSKNDNLSYIFDSLPVTAQKAILQTVIRDLDKKTPREAKLVPHIQEAIAALYDALGDEAVRNAKIEADVRRAMQSWATQIKISADSDAENLPGSEKFSNFARELATLFKYGKQTEIAKKLNAYYDAVQGTVDMFGETPAIPFKEAVELIFGIDYKSVDQVRREKHRKELADYLSTVADTAHPFELFGDDNFIDLLIKLGTSPQKIEFVRQQLAQGKTFEGFAIRGKLYLNADGLATTDKARSKYNHERQHTLTTKEQIERVMRAASRDDLDALVEALSESEGAYSNEAHDVLADEFISFAMEVAYDVDTDEELEAALQAKGANDELINIIKEINNEQRANDQRLGQSERLSNSRRHASVDADSEGRSPQGGRDSGQEPATVEQTGLRTPGSSTVGTGNGGTRESGTEGTGLSQVSSASASGEETARPATTTGNGGSNQAGAGVGQERGLGEVAQSPAENRETAETKAAEVEIGGALVDRLEDMGLSVSTDLDANRAALKAAKADKSEAGAIHYFKTPSGKQYGFAYKGKVYLDPTKINAELPIHEYGHLWAEALRRLSPENWQHVVDTIKADKDAWEFVKSLRPELTDENEIAEEVIATFSGKKGAERLKAEYERMHGKDADYKSKWGNIFQNISKAIQDFWKAVGDFLNIKYESAEQVYDQVLKDFVDNMNPWKRVSDYLQARDKEYVQAAESGDMKKATNLFYDALKENIGNGITPYMSVGTYTQLKRLAKGVKTRNEGVIKEAAAKIAPLIPDNAVLIPAPSHDGRATDMLDLAKAVAEITGSEVADVLRSAPRESQYQAKKATGVPMASGQLGITMEGTLPEGKTPIIIDNVVDSGNTAEACVQAVGRAVVVTIGDSAEQYRHAASLKSAAPVLRDKAGKVIPLSKRFEPKGSRYLGRRMYLSSNDPRFAISGTQVIPVGEKTLVGLHNISAEKLRKALKAGGLANPSAAVIDIARQNHHDYGNISLVLSSNMVENADGTYAGDAWTPMYPHVEYRLGKDTVKKIDKLVVGLPDNITYGIKRRIDDYMEENRRTSGLEYLFLKNKGIEVPMYLEPRRYPNISVKEIDDRIGATEEERNDQNPFVAYERMPEDQLFEFNLWLEKYGKEEEIKRVKDMIARLQSEGKDQAANTLIERYSKPMFFNAFDSIYHRVMVDERDAGSENIGRTLDNADSQIDELGYRDEFDEWLRKTIDDLGYDEVLFAGWTSDGDRRYVKNTVENASRLMNKESETNYLDRQSVNETKAMLMDKLRTLSDIRKHKGQLEPDDEKIREAYEQASNDWGQLGIDFRDYTTNEDKTAYRLDDNPFTAIDTALARLQEAMFKRDPIAFLNREYRYSLPADSEFGTRLKEMVKRIKNLPSRYFETKFRRPVYLNEFANAVVPNDLPQDLRAGLESAGLRLFSYDPNAQGSRRDATLEATAGEGIRFSINGRGASTGSSKRSNRDIEALRRFESVRPEIAKEMESIKNNALNDGTFMQAPNGKPTNLDERQWLQVRTRAFKRWFGDWENDPENASKVLDENGEPMVVYHRTNNKFTQFDPDRAREQSGWPTADFGFYFSNVNERGHYGRKSMPVFLNIRNPREIDVDYYADFDYNYKHADPEEMRKDNDGLQINIGRLILDEKATKVFVTPNPNQIKSATNNNGDFSEENDDIRFSISNQNNDIFYSNAERAVEGIKQEKATPEQWRAMIEKAGGLKAGEDKWIGLSDWLAQQRPTVTPQEGETRSQFVERLGEESKRFTISKQDILDYIREHKIQIEEVPYAEGLSTEAEQKLDEFNAEFEELIFEGDEETGSIYTSDWVDYAWRAMVDRYGDDFESAFEIEGEGTGSRLTPTMDYYGNYSDVALYFLGEGESRPINGTRLQYTTDGLQNKREIALVVPTIESWNQGDEIHFGDAGEGRAVAWVRFGDTHKIKEDWTDGEGNLHEGAEALEDVLVIDEIQSKRHQEGREHGYIEKSADKAMTDYTNMLYRKYGAQFNVKMSDEERMEYRRLQREREFERQDNLSRPTAAPFEKNWHELAMKRILRFAAENGYDKVAWTTGEQQAKRYDIGKEIDHIVKTDENTYEVYPTSGLMMTLEFDENGMYADEYDREYNGKSMSDIFGKDLAKRLKEMPVDETLQGDGLRVGYDGMKGFYDDILPRFMQKYGKKWGVQVGEVTMPDLEEGYQTMHAIDINDAMRESVMEGQPMFSISGRGVNGTIKPQEGETRSQYIARVAETVKNMTPRNTTIDDAIRFSITVNHNSPYLLKRADGSFVDPETGERLGFDHRFMGRGEGGQAHGWGSYFSANDIRSYGEGYGFSLRDIKDIFNTSRWQSFGVGDAFDVAKNYLLEAHSEHARSLRKWLEDRLAQKQELLKSYEGKVANSAEEDLMVFRAEADVQYIPALLRDMVNDIDTRNRHHYDVEIPENDGKNYLEEDKPLTPEQIAMLREQNDKDHAGLRGFLLYAERKNEQGSDEYPFRTFYSDLSAPTGAHMSPKAISEFLNRAGFVGIHYDGRRDGECYVIFNPDDAVITDHIRFSVTGSRGAANIDKMEGVTTRMDNLAAARQMEEDGKDAKTIRMATGWERGADGKWRYETPKDVQLDVDKILNDDRVNGRNWRSVYFKLEEVLVNNEEAGKLFEAYPDMKGMEIRLYDDPLDAAYGNYDEKARGYAGLININYHPFGERRPKEEFMPATFIHELQHAIQVREGFAIGGSVGLVAQKRKDVNEVGADLNNTFKRYGYDQMFYSKISDPQLKKEVDRVQEERKNDRFKWQYMWLATQPKDVQEYLLPFLRDTKEKIAKLEDSLRTIGGKTKLYSYYNDMHNVYRSISGEVEARNMENRMYLTPEERRAKLLSETEDVAREDQVVIMNAFDMANDDQIRFSVSGRGREDRDGNPIGDGDWHMNYKVQEFPEYPQISSRVDKSATTESVYVTYTNADNGRSVKVRFSGHRSNAERFGDVLTGGAPRGEILYRLGLATKEWQPFGYVPIGTISNKQIAEGNYEVADKTRAELERLPKGTDISAYKGKLVPGEPNRIYTGTFVGESQSSGIYIYKDANGNEIRGGLREAIPQRREDDQIRFSVNNPSTLSRSETVTKALVQQANNNYNIMQSALKKVTADLKGIRAAMRMQSDYDRKVVDALLNLYNTLLQENGVWAQYMPDTTRRIATQIVHAIGKQNITEEVNTIMDHMVHAQAKAAQRQWDKLRQTPIDKINISGVVMQGKVALEGQHALKAMNDALQANMTIEQIEEQINQLMDMEDNATDESLKTQYKGQWIGLTIAAQHLERLQHLQEERQQLDLELQSARSNKALKPAARQQLVDNIKQAMRDNYIEQAEAYTRSTQDLSEYVNTQEGRAKDFIRRQDANRDKIRSYAQRDLEGLATNPNRNRTRGNVARSIWDAFASPIRDLQSLLRLTGLHAPDGEGYLYNHFMRNWMDGADMERTGIVAASKTLDEKIAELTHGKYKTWEEAARKIDDASHNMFTITMLNGVDGKDMPVTEEIPLNAGNALYIYAVNKMNDGRMKLNGMNITEEDVQALADKVREQFGQEILDVVDWVQSEYFSQLRNRYNPTHEALFGAPMDAIENYFPLRINANARQQNEDLSEPDTDAARLLAGTSTGAIKRRTRNSLPLDVRNADFFQEVIRHISQMERWNAFAQWNRDANILFSDINFRNRIKGMNGTIYGSGDKLYNYMKDAFRVAIGTYKPKTDTFSEITLNMAKGVTSAKINFRIFTALKQIASFPAFFTYMQDGVFVQSYLRNWLKPHETMKWAKENLPNFEKRVSKRDMGDMRLMQRSTDWQWNKRILEWSSKYGMFFNVFFDTLTCATGARAVYDSHLADYMKKGYSEEDARNRARQDAEQAFNTSQQSSEGAFMSAVQQDRNLVTAALTVFRTSPIQYTRNFMYHTRNLLRKFGEGKRDEQIAFRMGQYKNDGLNDEQARKAAEKDYNKSLRQDIVGFVVYGALLNILWRLAGQIPYLLLGDDDDKKKQILDDATSGGAWFSPFTGLLGGGIVESALDGNGSVADMFAPEMPFTQDIKRAGQYLSNDKYAEFASQALSVLMQSGTGFDPLTASDMVSRIVTTLDSEEELEAATQALRVSQALLSIPQSQYEQMLIDKVVSGETDEDTALEDYIRYQKIHTAPLTWFMRGEESDEKAEENAEKRFNKLLTERDKLHNPEDYEE